MTGPVRLSLEIDQFQKEVIVFLSDFPCFLCKSEITAGTLASLNVVDKVLLPKSLCLVKNR